MIYLSTCVDITNKHLVKNKQILFMITLLPTQFQVQGQIHSDIQLFSGLFPKFPTYETLYIDVGDGCRQHKMFATK